MEADKLSVLLQTRNEAAVFTINGKVYRADKEVPVNTSLNSFIRDYAHLTGTKVMCKEGSCGSCVVNIKYVDRTTRRKVSLAVNSCLIPVLACHGFAITTVEGLGSRSVGYHKIQSTLANFNGTQCGFCSPGFVMSMYSLLDSKQKSTVQDVENNFSGNLCRCTGYRPILDAFKSLAVDAPSKLKRKFLEIEESHLSCQMRGCCNSAAGGGDTDDHKRCMTCVEFDEDNFELDFAELTLIDEKLCLQNDTGEWYRPSTVREIFQIFDRIGNKSYILLAGNTARAVKKPQKDPEVYIDVNNVSDLKGFTQTNLNLTLGSGTHINELIGMAHNAANNKPDAFGFGLQMANHLELVANVPVRNRATVGGNLSLVNNNNEFPSDIFLLLDALSATITIANPSGSEKNVSTTEFLKFNMNKNVITRVSIPAQKRTTVLKSYKIMPVNQSAIAIVNAAFLYDVDSAGKLNGQPSLVFSGINSNFRHAYKTEKYLTQKNIFNSETLKQAITTLWSEVQPDSNPVKFSPEYRKLLAVALFYRSILSLAGDKASGRNRSGATELMRPVSSGKQVFQTDEKEYPLTQPIPKIDAQIQTSGEAIYINDYVKLRTELVASFVLAKKFADIANIDPSRALKMKGVVGFYSAKDIDGINFISYIFPQKSPWDSELFSSGPVNHWGQPVGIIVATTEDIAEMAADQVIIGYKKTKTPLVSIQDILASPEKDARVKLNKTQKATKPGQTGKNAFAGEMEVTQGGQYAHAMETPTCRVIPEEDGNFTVYVTTHSITATRVQIANVMGIPNNKVDCIVPRLGGSFGSKNTSHLFAACGCTLAASKLKRPVRMRMSLQQEMDAVGKRTPFYVKYQGQADENGKIQNLDLDIYLDTGIHKTTPDYLQVLFCIQNYFDTSTWNINIYYVLTDKPPAVILRAPGFLEPISIIEQIMDHMAFTSNLDPIGVRLANSSDPTVNGYIKSWRSDSDFDKRKQEIDQFNQENRWKKKGLALSAMKYPVLYIGTRYECTVDILYPDGSVQVQHGGIEMGQGINTKVAQAVAHELNLPLKNIQIKQTSSYSSPNSTATLGSATSELIIYGAIECCKQLNAGLAPIRASLQNPTWKDIINKAFDSRVALSKSLPLTPIPDEKNQIYQVYGVCVAETELDILTGKHQVTRVDILEDAGKSLSPEVDVGQVEGAFIMAHGLQTTERLVFDKKTGELLTDRLWLYYIPRSKDIPIDFRVTFVPNASNPTGVLNSKATGEPAAALAVSVINSLRYGILSARKDAGLKDLWTQLSSPCTPETLLLASGTSTDQFTL